MYNTEVLCTPDCIVHFNAPVPLSIKFVDNFSKIGRMCSIKWSLPFNPICGSSLSGISFFKANDITRSIASMFKDWITVFKPSSIPSTLIDFILAKVSNKFPVPVLEAKSLSVANGNCISSVSYTHLTLPTIA